MTELTDKKPTNTEGRLYFDKEITSRIQGNAIIACIDKLRQLGIKISRWFFCSDFPYLLFPITW